MIIVKEVVDKKIADWESNERGRGDRARADTAATNRDSIGIRGGGAKSPLHRSSTHTEQRGTGADESDRKTNK